MRNLFRFILHNHVFFLFLLLEILSFIFIFNFNHYQKVRFLNTSSEITGKVYDSFSKMYDFFRLPAINRELSAENARLRSILGVSGTPGEIADSLVSHYPSADYQFNFIPARIINNTVNRQQNFLTLDKGLLDGIKPEMGIITANGVVGIVTHVSPSYASGISLLNTRWNVSAKLSRNGYFGSLVWDGKDYRKALLNDIPFHVDISAGDTVVTSGYSVFFPEGILLGTVESFEKGGGDNFYTIRVILSVDFKAISYVEVIENIRKSEIENITRRNGTDEITD